MSVADRQRSNCTVVFEFRAFRNRQLGEIWILDGPSQTAGTRPVCHFPSPGTSLPTLTTLLLPHLPTPSFCFADPNLWAPRKNPTSPFQLERGGGVLSPPFSHPESPKWEPFPNPKGRHTAKMSASLTGSQAYGYGKS